MGAEKYVPKAGDRVRVVLEGEARTGGCGFGIGRRGGANFITPDAEHVVSIEKVEPPVVTFKRGDTVRRLGTSRLYTIGHGGYFAHESSQWRTPDSRDFNGTHLPFDSEHYELVELR